jgi:hypothetical protein
VERSEARLVRRLVATCAQEGGGVRGRQPFIGEKISFLGTLVSDFIIA